jgi:hypothetical protein
MPAGRLYNVSAAQRRRNAAAKRIQRAWRRRRKTFKYPKGTSYKAKSYRGNNIIPLRTLSAKQQTVSISYRKSIDFTNMGYDAGSTPCIIKIDLNNPTIGQNLQTGGIVQVLGSLKNGATDPVFQQSTYQNEINLISRLEDQFDNYLDAVVVSSQATVSIRPKANQVGRDTNGDAASLVPYFSNQAPAQGGDPTTLSINEANLDGDLSCWCVRQQLTGNLYDTTGVNGVLPLSTLKMGVPGVKMKKITVTPHTKPQSVNFKVGYSPKRAFGISDWKDNKATLRVYSDQVNANLKKNYAYIGIASKKPATSTFKPCNCVVEVSVKYNINFSRRKNIDGANDPVARIVRGRGDQM